MKVLFVLCVAIFLANAVDSSPIDSDVDNEVIIEADNEQVFEPIQMFSVDEISLEGEIEHEEPSELQNNEEIINEPSEDVAVPNENEIEGEVFQLVEEVEVKLTEEQKERMFGIRISLCAQHTDNRNALHLSHLTDCNKFYKCYLGQAYLMDCPRNMHWSVNLNRCDYPEVARCRMTGTYQFKQKRAKVMQASEQEPDQEDNDKPELGTFEVDPRCEGSDPFKPLHFKHISDCSKFYKCYMGKAYVIKCPKGQQWGQHLQRCEHPQLARCSIFKPAFRPAQAEIEDEDEEIDEEEIHEHTIADDEDFVMDDPRCAILEADVYHPIQFSHPSDCTMFYKCVGRQAYKSQCPGGLQYNAKKQFCDYPEKARCRIKVHPAIRPAQAEYEEFSAEIEDDYEDEPSIIDDPDYEIEDSRCMPDEPDMYHPVHFPHPSDCTMFYKCFDHKAYKSQCPWNLHFNDKEQYCDYPSNANCKLAPVFAQASASMPSNPDYSQMNQYPNMAEIMSQFQGMFGQFPEMMNQFPGMMNQYPGMMNQHPQVQIPMRPQEPIQRPQEQPQKFPGAPEYPSWMPVPNQNIAYPEMPLLSEKPSHEKPGSVKEFDYQNGKASSRCPSEDEPFKPTHLSHETECQKFYKCFNGRAFLMECPASQEWSDELQRCDYHQFANCDPIELVRRKIQH